MTITESQRRTLDLMAESAGWSWADVEALAQEMFRECVAGLNKHQAYRLLDDLAAEDEFNADRILEDLIPDLIEFLGPRVLNIEDASWMWGTEDGSDHDSEVRNMRTWLEFLRRAQAFRKVVADASA